MRSAVAPAEINSENVENATEYKYRGTIMDNNCIWTSNTDCIFRR